MLKPVLLWALLGCAGPGDAQRYVRAVGGEGTFEAARDLCLGMDDD